MPDDMDIIADLVSAIRALTSRLAREQRGPLSPMEELPYFEGPATSKQYDLATAAQKVAQYNSRRVLIGFSSFPVGAQAEQSFWVSDDPALASDRGWYKAVGTTPLQFFYPRHPVITQGDWYATSVAACRISVVEVFLRKWPAPTVNTPRG